MGEATAMTPALLASFLAMMATGVPVAIAMAGSALVYILLTGDLPPFVVVHRMISGIDSFPLLAVPFFIMAGNLMNNAGITNRIYDFALALVGWLKGGLGPCQHHRLGDLRRHVGYCDRRRRGLGHDRDQGDERQGLRHRSFRSASPRLPPRSARSFRRRCRS